MSLYMGFVSKGSVYEHSQESNGRLTAIGRFVFQARIVEGSVIFKEV